MHESNSFRELIDEREDDGFRNYNSHRIIRFLKTNEVVVLKSLVCAITIFGILTIASISINCKQKGKGISL